MNENAGFRKNHLVLAVVVLLVQQPLQAADKEFAQTKGSQWYPCLEWTINNPSFDGNLFDVDAKVSLPSRKIAFVSGMRPNGRTRTMTQN